ncbi:MAG: phosphoribosylanthranilate isomerase [Spirochaetes bacterium]|nr:phosphoribosylanthranilate isomerase [Spirochaetota bacterium]
MVLVKFCGLTRRQDYHAAVAAGAAFTGFIFHPGSPRFLSPSAAAQLVEDPPPGPHRRVGVFVDATIEAIRGAAASARLDLIQLHGRESPEFARELGLPYWKAIRLREPGDLAILESHPTQTFLIDAWHPDRHGGTGRALDLDLVAAALARARTLGKRLVVAGGLSAENLAAVLALRPWAVDLNSGVEVSPGIKDPAAIGAVMDLVGLQPI